MQGLILLPCAEILGLLSLAAAGARPVPRSIDAAGVIVYTCGSKRGPSADAPSDTDV